MLQGKLGEETKISVDSVTGKKIPDSCLSAWPKPYVKAVTIKEVHDILFYVNKDDPNGPVPTDPSTDPMFSRWEKPVQQWAKKNNYISAMPATEDCSLRVNTSSPTITIDGPAANTTITDPGVTVTTTIQGFSANTSVQFLIDGTAVTTVTAAPYSATLDLSGIANGFHTISANASDDAGLTASASVTVNILAHQSTSLYFMNLTSHQKIAAVNLPLTVQAFVYDPAGISQVSLDLDNPDGTISVLDQGTPSGNLVNLSCPTLTPGTYRLYLAAKTKAGKSVESDRLTITIT